MNRKYNTPSSLEGRKQSSSGSLLVCYRLVLHHLPVQKKNHRQWRQHIPDGDWRTYETVNYQNLRVLIGVLPFSSGGRVKQPLNTGAWLCGSFMLPVPSEVSEQTSLGSLKFLISAKSTTIKTEVCSLVVPYMLTELAPLMMEIRKQMMEKRDFKVISSRVRQMLLSLINKLYIVWLK